MRRRRHHEKIKWMQVLMLLTMPFALLALLECSSKRLASNEIKVDQQPSLLDQRKIAEDTFIYAYPIVLMDVTRDVMTNVPRPTPGKSPKAPIDQIAHFRSFPDDTFTDIVTPNADTLYSNAWIDLSREPVVLSTPDTGKRYFMTPLMDAWTNVFFSPGTRTRGNGKANYLIVGPGWNGSVPDGMQRVDAPTNLVWMLGRFNCSSVADCKAANKTQDQLKLTALGQWGNKQALADTEVDQEIDMKTPPPKQVAEMEADEFLEIFADLLKENPPSLDDDAIVSEMAKIGIVPGQDFDLEKLSQESREAIADGLRDGKERLIKDVQLVESDQPVNGWVYTRPVGEYGNNYDQRAAIAWGGLGANLEEDAVYPHAVMDAEGNKLVGANKYKLHFEKEQLPPVRAFWSMSMYDSKHHFIKNGINRFAIGDRSSLKYNKDGSLDLYIQNQTPEKNLTSNWLPAPKEEFIVVFRMYWPQQAVLDRTYKVPGIEHVNEVPRISQFSEISKMIWADLWD